MTLVNVLLFLLTILGFWTTLLLFRRRNLYDRLLGVDVLGLLLVSLLVLLSIVRQDPFYLDLALILGGVGFVATVAWVGREERP